MMFFFIYRFSVLSMIHVGGGDRFLLTGSFDRSIVVWDLNNDTHTTYPKRKIITDGAWLTNWIAFVIAGDESYVTNKGKTDQTIVPIELCVLSEQMLERCPTDSTYQVMLISAWDLVVFLVFQVDLLIFL